jgi:integrase
MTTQRTDLNEQREVLAASKNDIGAIYNYLQKESSTIYADVWKIGVNLSLRIGDLLSIKFADLNLNDRTLVLTEEKTGKSKTIRLNNAAIEVINARRVQYPNDVYLFQVHSNRASNKPISRVAVSVKFKECGDVLRIKGINTHSMRKSRGKAMFDDGVAVETIAKVLNHSNTSTTLRYLGITKEQVLQTYDDYEL